MKKLFAYVLALAGFLGINVSTLAQDYGGLYNEKIPLELDGWVGDGGNYAVFIGIRPYYNSTPYIFKCGFTVQYSIGDAAYNIKLVGEAHYSPNANCLTSFNEVSAKYYYPMDNGYAFLRLNETYIGPWPTGLSFMSVTFIPDNPAEIWDFQRINLDAGPFIWHLSKVTADGGKPVGVDPANWHVVKSPN